MFIIKRSYVGPIVQAVIKDSTGNEIEFSQVQTHYSGHIQIAGYLYNCLIPNSFRTPRMNVKRFERMFRR